MLQDLPLALLVALPALPPALAQDPPAAPAAPVVEAAPEPVAVVTHHQIELGGTEIAYSATAGWLILEDENGKPRARFGYTAYTRDGFEDPATRPLLFAFNGGPGSSSLWLHLGVLGPRRVDAVDAAHSPPAPIRLLDNAESVLDVTDLVLIDPVGTGFSKALGDKQGKDFWGVDADLESVGAFVERYVTRNDRWPSPKYVLGESYGGMRAAGLVNRLQSSEGMNFNGVVLVSPFLDMGVGMDGADIDLPHVLYLPTLVRRRGITACCRSAAATWRPSWTRSSASPTTSTRPPS
jgi:carboxypeptidase C (cathepsin A)